MSRNSGNALKAVTAAFAICAVTSAQASQGPGVPVGTASPLTQTLMAVIVYGSVTLMIAWGLIGGLRQR